MTARASPRVLFCSQAAYVGGGMEAWLDAASRLLREAGFDVHVALARGPRFHSPRRYLATHALRAARVHAVGEAARGQEARVAALWRLFRRLRPDVVIPVGLADALYAAAIEKDRGSPGLRLVACLHGQDDGPLADVARCAPRLDLVVAVSRRGADRARAALGAEGPRVLHVPFGAPAPVAPRVPHEGLNVLYVGRLDDVEKRVLDLVPFARALAPARVVVDVHGDGPDGPRLAAAVRDAGLGAVVRLHGASPRGELYASAYPASDALVVFSPREGGPVVAWEAMVHGVVPVVSDYEGRREEGVLRDGENALVFPVGRPDLAAEAVRRLEDRALCARLSASAAALPAPYREQGFGDAWASALRDVLGRPARREPWLAPALRSRGRLSALPIGIEHLACLRRLSPPFSRTAALQDAGDEWPSTYGGA